MAYDLSAIKMNVNLGDTNKVIGQYNTLVKTLETKHVKLEIDVSALQASVGIANKEIEKVYQKVAEEAKKASKASEDLYNNFTTKKSLVSGFDMKEFTGAFKEARKEALEIQNITANYGKNNKGQKTGQLDSVMVQYSNSLGKVVTETLAWAEKTDNAGNTVGRQWQNVSTKVSENKQAMEQLDLATKKAVSNMTNKLQGLTIGKEWVKDLKEFQSLQTMVDAFDPTNMKMLKQDAVDIAEGFKNLGNAIKTVNVGDSISKDFEKASIVLEKFKASMTGKISNIEIGKDTTWATQLSQFETLKTKMGELQAFKLDTTNIEQYKTIVNEVAVAYANTKDEIARVKNEQHQMSQTQAIDDKVVNKVRDFNTELEILKRKYGDIQSNPLFQQIQTDVNKLNNTPPTQFNNSVNEIGNNMKKLKAEMNTVAKTGTGLFENLGNSIKSAFSFMSGSMLIYKFATDIRQIPKIIQELDTELIDLKKTTTMTNDELDRFYNTSNDLAKQIGVSTNEIISQASAWSRLGYSTKEQIETMSKVSAIFKNISPDMSMDDATDGLVSTMKAFNIEADKAIDGIASKINIIGNTQAVSNKDIVEFLTRSSSAMAEANNSLEETIALGTAATEITRDAAGIGQVLKTTSMKIRGYSEETQSYTEDVEVLSGSIADLTKTASNMGGISLFTDETKTTYKSTYKILEEISEIYDELTDKNQAELLEVLAGKRNGQAIAAILNNFSSAKSSMESMANSQGNAMKEMEILYDSIGYKLNSLRESWVGLSQDFLSRDMFKGFIEGTTNVLNFIDACGGLQSVLTGVITSFIALKTASFFLNGGDIVAGVSSIVKSLFTLKTVTDVATGSTLALSMAQKLLIGGVIVAGVMAIGASINYLSKSSQRAEESVQTLKQELADLNTEVKDGMTKKVEMQDLASQYEKLKALKEAQGLTNEEQADFTRIQNEIKEIMPEVNYYIDSQGNAILDQATTLENLNEQLDKYLESKRQEAALKANEVASANISQYEKETEDLKDLIEYQNLYNQYVKDSEEPNYKFTDHAKETEKELANMIFANKSAFESIEYKSRDTFRNMEGDATEAINAIKASHKSMADEINDNVISIMAGTEEWTKLTDNQENAIRRMMSEFSDAEIKHMSKMFQDGSTDVGEYVERLKDIPKILSYIKEATESTNNALAYQAKTQEEIEETVSKLSKAYKESSADIEQLEKAMDELNEIHDLTNETRDAMIEKYPELLGLIGDEATQREFLSAKIQEQEEIHRQSLLNMLEYDQEFYKNRILGSEENSIAIRSFYQDMVDGLGLDYQVDLDNFTTLASLKEDIAAQSASNIQSLWSQLSYNGMAMGQMSHAPDFSLDDIIPNNNFAPKGISKRSIGAKKTGGSKSKSGSSKADLPKYLTQGYDDTTNEILAKGDKLEREIEQANTKILNAQLLGNTEEELAIQTQLEGMYDKRIELEKEKSVAFIGLRKKLTDDLAKKNLSELKGINIESITEKQLADVNRKMDVEIDKANKAKKDKFSNDLSNRKAMINEYAKTIMDANSNVNSIAKNVWDLENESIERTISLIEKRYELEDKLINDRIRGIDIELMLTKDGSADQLKLQKQKYDEQLNIQNNHLKRIKEYREQEIEMDAEVIQKQIDGWYDAERERLNMLKSMGEQAKKLKLDSLTTQQTDLNEAQKATQNLVDMVIKMLKQQYDEEKRLIQENSKAKEDAIKKEIDGYKKIIDAKKKSLREDKNNKDYDKELKTKQKKVSDIENKILVIANDNSKKAQAERLRLEEEKLGLIDELNEFQEGRSIELQEKALDEELKRYENAKNEELDKYKKQKDDELKILDDHLAKEGNLRAEAIRLIEKKNRSLYDDLIAWNKEYSTGVDSDVSDAWDSAYDAMDTYNNGQLNVLNTLGKIADKLKEVKADIQEVNNSSWQDYVEQEDIRPNKSKFPVYDTEPSKKPSNSSSGSSSKPKKEEPKLTVQQAKEELQSSQQRYLHEQAKKAKSENNAGLLKWVEDERKKWSLDPKTGSVSRAGGIPADVWQSNKKKYGYLKGGETDRTGFHWLDGSQKLPERILSPEQTQSFNKMVEYLPNVINKIEQFEKTDNNTSSAEVVFHIDKMVNVEGSLDKDFDIGKMKDEVMKAINQVLANKGIKPQGIRLANGRV